MAVSVDTDRNLPCLLSLRMWCNLGPRNETASLHENRNVPGAGWNGTCAFPKHFPGPEILPLTCWQNYLAFALTRKNRCDQEAIAHHVFIVHLLQHRIFGIVHQQCAERRRASTLVLGECGSQVRQHV